MNQRQVWIIAGILTTLFILGLLGLAGLNQRRELEEARAELAQLRSKVDTAQAEAEKLQQQNAAARQQIEQLQQEKENVTRKQHSLEDEMRAALESRDVTISQLQGKLTVNILDRILFDSGEAELKPDGGKVLDKVAAVLAQHPNIKIHVIGHTDNVPIRPSSRSRFGSNWELSMGRAVAAVRYLTERAGVDPRRLGAVGYGEFRPIADNATAEGRARNRRIAITILSDEVVGADTAAPAAGTTPTREGPTETPVPGPAEPAPQPNPPAADLQN